MLATRLSPDPATGSGVPLWGQGSGCRIGAFEWEGLSVQLSLRSFQRELPSAASLEVSDKPKRNLILLLCKETSQMGQEGNLKIGQEGNRKRQGQELRVCFTLPFVSGFACYVRVSCFSLSLARAWVMGRSRGSHGYSPWGCY